MSDDKPARKMIWITVFGISMAFVESVVVVYLRTIYYSEGFTFPLKPMTDNLILFEVFREVATILMLFSVAVLAGKRLWERFACFLYCFGVWDIFYYIWLKVMLDWPKSIFDWDILFLIPFPWIGPVIAPVSISLLMIVFGLVIIDQFNKGVDFRPALISRILVLLGTMLILFSFMRDSGAALKHLMPNPYWYGLLIAGELLYLAAFGASYFKTLRRG